MKKLVSELEVGDIVLQEGRYIPKSLAVVERVTKNFVIIGPHKYRKVDTTSALKCTADKWAFGKITTLEKEEAEELYRKEVIERKRTYLANSHFNGLTSDIIEKVYELVKSNEKQSL